MDKAKALFEYVQLHIEYDYYFDTHKGAVETLNSKKGNGADQAHLLIAMYRAAGLKARYVHGYSTFYLGGKPTVMFGLRFLLVIHGFAEIQPIWPINSEAYHLGM